MNRWSEMQAFVESVKEGSFTAAGQNLQLSPSAVSKLISRLEARLAVRLLNRTTRQISLTEAGQSFYQRCCEILHELDDAETELTELGQTPRGRLKVNCSPGFAKHQVLPLLPEFQLLYPDLSIELQLTGQAVDLVSEGIDLAIRLGNLEDSSLVARSLGKSKRFICASPAYIECKGKPSIPDELQQHNCLRLSTSEVFNQWRFTAEDKEHFVSAKGNFITDNVEALYEYALQGGGIVRLSGFMVEEDISQGRLIPLLTEYETDPQWVNVLYPHRTFLPVKVKVFIEFLQQRLANASWSVAGGELN
ncbi:LysR family transcriptional regulator [Neptuniibacter sp.]|uniref:LysR family transcriptional regulator n=1 Tax=Neptuniibacter sp. TaxID=1962643 RepID=UPI00260A7D17|nr:LysR family transcriptional regulator [Neptuniibacter sp.]MCP4595452.1 LysR family transcriptional regulator [Neptuniibacter sp.]